MKKRLNYYDLICDEITLFTRKALSYRDAKAWANRKDKAYKKIVPRGRIFDRLHKQEWSVLVKRVNNIEPAKWQEIKT